MSAEAVAEAPPAEGDGGVAAEPEAAAPAEEGKPEAAEGPPPEAPPAPAEEAPATAPVGEAPPAASADEDSQRAATAQVVKELLGVALKDAEGIHKTVTIGSETKQEPAIKSDEQMPKVKESGAVPSIEEPGVEKPVPVPSEMKKDSLVSRERKSKFSMAKVHKSSFRFRTMSGSAMVIRTGAEKGPKYENSYWLTSKVPFNVDKVNTMLRAIVDDRIAQVTEKPKLQEISSSIVTETLAKIKNMAFERYRFVCVCLVGEKIDQGLRCSFRMLWDAEQDNYAWYTVEQTRFFVVASVFGIYYD